MQQLSVTCSFLAIRSPLGAICPICRAHFALGYVLSVSRFEASALFLHFFGLARLGLTGSRCTLLAKTDGFDLVTFFCHHNVAFLRVRRVRLGLLKPETPARASRGSFLTGISYLVIKYRLVGASKLLQAAQRTPLRSWLTGRGPFRHGALSFHLAVQAVGHLLPSICY